VRSVLIGTDTDNRIAKSDLFQAVKQIMSGREEGRVEELTNAALGRLVKRQIVRLHTKDSTVCLSYEESIKTKEQLAACQLDEVLLTGSVKSAVVDVYADTNVNSSELELISSRIRRILEKCLYSLAETFAHAVLTDRISDVSLDHLKQTVLDDIASDPPSKGSPEGTPELLSDSVLRVLNDPSPVVRQYLKCLADAYTLMIFLSMTPDVQGAIQKIFAYGEIWLDTTIILPMLAEGLLEESPKRIQQIIQMTRDAGIELYTTSGVLEELTSHFNRALVCHRIPASQWEGGMPYIFEAYVRSGKDQNEFARWVETLMGEQRPAEDLGLYLEEVHGIKKKDLLDEVAAADASLRGALDLIWSERHQQRRQRNQHSTNARELDPLTVLRLAKHDVESYLGVLQRRKSEITSQLGYRSWWLTFDSFALRVERELRKHVSTSPASPVMSIDFLAQYLSLGPVRGKLPKQTIQQLPISVQPRLVEFLTPELLDEAKNMRLSLAGLPERVIARKVRDHLDKQRRLQGPISQRGPQVVFDEIADLEI
jgi:hypothetical protein